MSARMQGRGRYFVGHRHHNADGFGGSGGSWYDDLKEAISQAEEWRAISNLPRRPELETDAKLFVAQRGSHGYGCSLDEVVVEDEDEDRS
jgi:hypothetical protein